MNVWEPKIQQTNEFSLCQIWILGGSFGEDLNSIEAGWQVPSKPSIYIISSILMSIVESDVKNVNNFQVSPDLYGDNNTRLFTYWTVSISFYAFLLKKHHLFFNFVKIFIFNLNFTE